MKGFIQDRPTWVSPCTTSPSVPRIIAAAWEELLCKEAQQRKRSDPQGEDWRGTRGTEEQREAKKMRWSRIVRWSAGYGWELEIGELESWRLEIGDWRCGIGGFNELCWTLKTQKRELFKQQCGRRRTSTSSECTAQSREGGQARRVKRAKSKKSAGRRRKETWLHARLRKRVLCPRHWRRPFHFNPNGSAGHVLRGCPWKGRKRKDRGNATSLRTWADISGEKRRGQDH